ncbi:MAG: DUF6268 family outer membrane beta-barrel protein [Planctomycetota bacterium]
MRIHFARVVLVACSVVASAASQAPTSPSSNSHSGSSRTSPRSLERSSSQLFQAWSLADQIAARESGGRGAAPGRNPQQKDSAGLRLPTLAERRAGNAAGLAGAGLAGAGFAGRGAASGSSFGFGARSSSQDPRTQNPESESALEGYGREGRRLEGAEWDGRERYRDDGTYSLETLFRQYHGEFMDRYEGYNPAIELRLRTLPNQRINGDPGAFDLIGYDGDLEFPMLISTEAYLLFGVYQYGRHYNTTTPFGSRGNPGFNTESNLADFTLTAAGVRLGFGLFLDDNWLLEVETNPGVYSDLEGGLHHKDYDFPSSALMTYRPVDNFFFKFGVRYNQVYEDAPWLPYLGFSWEIFESLRIDFLLPENVEISYWPTTSTSLAFGAMIQGAQYHVRSSSGTGKQRADVQVQEVITYFGLTHRFSDQFSLQTRAGLVVAGDYDLTSGARNFERTRGALDQGFYADITLGFDW